MHLQKCAKSELYGFKALLNCFETRFVENSTHMCNLFGNFENFQIIFRSVTKTERNSDESASEPFRNVFQRNFAPDS